MHNNTTFKKKSPTNLLKKANVQETMLTLAIFLIMGCILFDATDCAISVTSGLKLFFTAVLPGLLPFMFLCKILSNFNFKRLSSFSSKFMNKLFDLNSNCFHAFFMSIISGYPIGSKITTDLFLQGKINNEEVIKCATLSSTSGLIFVIGTVGSIMLGSVKIGIVLYVSNIIATIISVFLLNILERKKQKTQTEPEKNKNENQKHDILKIITTATKDTTESLLIVCFYVTFFALMIDILKKLKVTMFFAKLISHIFGLIPEKMELSEGIMSGIIEMTSGIKILSKFKSKLSICLISSLISFGGFSIILQSLSFLSKTKIKFSKFVFSKFLQAILSFFICFLLVSTFSPFLL